MDNLTVGNSQVPDEADALYTQGMAHYRRREWKEAKACFVRLKSIAPDRRGVDALLNEVDIFIQLQAMQPDQQEAVTRGQLPVTSDQAAGLGGTQASTYSGQAEAVTAQPARRRLSWPAAIVIVLAVLMGIASVLYAAGVLDNVIGSQRQARVQALVNQGRAAMNVGDCERAAKVFGEALALAPNNDEVKTLYQKAQRCQQLASWCTQAEANIAAEQWSSALDILEKIIALDPTSCNASEKLAFVKKQQALDVQFAKAQEYVRQRKWSEAIKLLEQLQGEAPTFKPNNVRQTLFLSHFGQGVDLMASAGDSLDLIGEAIQSFDSALSISPDDKTAMEERRLADLYRQGYLLVGQRNWPQAVIILQQIYRSRPDYMGGKVASMLCSSYLRLGDAYYAAGNLQEALQQYRNVLDIKACDHVEAAVKEREVYGILYPPTPTPTITPTPTRTPRPTPTWTATPSPPPLPPPPPPTATPDRS